MWLTEQKFIGGYDLCVFNIAVLSGTRTPGRTIDTRSQGGRLKNGILYITEGETHFFEENGNELTADCGKLILLPKGHRYRMQYVSPKTSFILVNFDAVSPSGTPVTLSDKLEMLTKEGADKRIANILNKMKDCSPSEDSSTVFRLKELFYRLLSVIFEEDVLIDTSKPKYANIIPGVTMLRRNYLENIAIPQLAAACNISVSSFRALFTECYGMSPIQYRNHLRIKRAKTLLADGGYTVADVAAQSGFDNVSYFIRFYKKVTGETPSETQTKNK